MKSDSYIARWTAFDGPPYRNSNRDIVADRFEWPFLAGDVNDAGGDAALLGRYGQRRRFRMHMIEAVLDAIDADVAINRPIQIAYGTFELGIQRHCQFSENPE